MLATVQVNQYNRTTPTTYRVGTLYPSGRATVCMIPSPKRKQKISVLTNDEKENLRNLSAANGVLYAARSAAGASLLGLLVMARTALPEAHGEGGRLGLSNGLISRKRPRGSGGINGRQRDILQWAVGFIEWKYGRRCLSFLTLTLPTFNQNVLVSVREHWAELVKRVVEEIKRELKRNGISSQVLGATEIQMERSERDGTAVPHLHLVFKGKRHPAARWAFTHEWIRAVWKRLITNLIGEHSEDYAAAENLVPVKKSAARYLSKYLSKCASKVLGDAPSFMDWHPSDWIVLGIAFRKAYKKLTLRLTTSPDTLLETLLNLARSGEGWVRPIELETESGTRRIGWGGHSRRLATSYLLVNDTLRSIIGLQCKPI